MQGNWTARLQVDCKSARLESGDIADSEEMRGICAYQLRKEDSAARVRKKIAHGVSEPWERNVREEVPRGGT